jgi:CopG family transcriptional regulator/antitoxin EndoAI
LPDSLLATLDQLARKWSTTRSGAVAELLQSAKRREIEKQMREGYSVLAEIHQADAELFLPAQVEVLRNGN